MMASAMTSRVLAAGDLGNLLYLIALLIFAVLGQLAKKWQERRQAEAGKPPREEIEDAEVVEDEEEERPWIGRPRPVAPPPRLATRPPPLATPIGRTTPPETIRRMMPAPPQGRPVFTPVPPLAPRTSIRQLP